MHTRVLGNFIIVCSAYLVRILVLPTPSRPTINTLISLRRILILLFFFTRLLISVFGVDSFSFVFFLDLGFTPPVTVLLLFLPFSFLLFLASPLDFDSLCLEKEVNLLFLFFISDTWSTLYLLTNYTIMNWYTLPASPSEQLSAFVAPLS